MFVLIASLRFVTLSISGWTSPRRCAPVLSPETRAPPPPWPLTTTPSGCLQTPRASRSANQNPGPDSTDQWEAGNQDISEVLTVTTRHLLTITVKEFLFGPSVAALPVNPELPSVGHWSRSGSGVANAFYRDALFWPGYNSPDTFKIDSLKLHLMHESDWVCCRCWPWPRRVRGWRTSACASGTGTGASWRCRTSGRERRTTSWSAPAQSPGSWVRVSSICVGHSMLYFSDGPIAQTGAPYAKVPGIRVYGMLCLVNGKKRRRKARVMWGSEREAETNPVFPPVPDHFWGVFWGKWNEKTKVICTSEVVRVMPGQPGGLCSKWDRERRHRPWLLTLFQNITAPIPNWTLIQWTFKPLLHLREEQLRGK